MAYELRRHLFTVEEYEAMGRASVLDADVRTELIEGEVIEMSAMGFPHARCVANVTTLFVQRLQGHVRVNPQVPFFLSEMSMPEPDVTLVSEEWWRTATYHPAPADVILLVEVSDSTLPFDRGRKLSLYARAGLREVWIVDVKGRAVEIFRSPEPNGHRFTYRADLGSTLMVEAFPDVTFTVDEIFA